MTPIKAYKAFDRTLKCLNFQYEEGKTFEMEAQPVLCKTGFHFCKDLVLTLQYYPADKITDNKYAEVEILGDTAWEEPTRHKGCTNKIRIVRVLSDEEVLSMVDQKQNSGDWNSGDWNSGNSNSGDWNSGNRNSGNRNSGNSNSGNRNSGNRNSGNRNSGDWNSGDWNSGDSNSGNCNSGDSNSGNCNSGNWNSGNSNSGDWNSGNSNSGNWNSGNWNSGSYNTGVFNTITPEDILIFNKPCRRLIWNAAQKPSFLYFTPDKELGYKKSFQKAYAEATVEEKEQLLQLPNFDADVFFEISGIDVRKDNV